MNTFITDINGICFNLATEPSLFSPEQVDKGTLAMLSAVDLERGQKLLDLGCGYGIVGLYAAHFIGPDNIWLLDKSSKAVELSRINAVANNLEAINILLSDGPEVLLQTGHQATFDWILSNPPYHEDFSIARRFIEASFKLLKTGGKLVLVVKRLKWYNNKLRSVFGGAKIHNINGYYVLVAEKRSHALKLSKTDDRQKTTKKHQKKIQKSKKTHRSIDKNDVPS